ncbi:MAG: hypothetical protein J0I23_31160 [Rhizobiales bacterium]|nr:hypothetical protein [Hyphomicrobiales bacterium]
MTDLLTEKKKVKLTASDIRVAMSKRWATAEYAIMWEVANATGASARRYADAVIMSLWPSRGLELHGVEIKISRSDWKREAADPAKAEAVAGFCDRWWIHTPPGIVDDLSALPPAWGLREYDGRQWTTIREAAKNDPRPIDRPFLAALLRRADGSMRAMIEDAQREGRKALEEERQKQNERYQANVEAEASRRTAHLERAAKKIEAFEAAFGEGSAASWAIDHARLGRAALALHQCEERGMGKLSDRLRKAADEIDAIVGMIDPPKEEGPPCV